MNILRTTALTIAMAAIGFLVGYTFCDYHNSGSIVLLDGAEIRNVSMRNIHMSVDEPDATIAMENVRINLVKTILPPPAFVSIRCDTNGTISNMHMVGNWDLYDDLIALFVGYPPMEMQTGSCANEPPSKQTR